MTKKRHSKSDQEILVENEGDAVANSPYKTAASAQPQVETPSKERVSITTT